MRQTLSKEQKRTIGQLVREQLVKNAIENTRQGVRKLVGSAKELASEARVSDAVIYKLHSGDFSNKTLRLVESILGVEFRAKLDEPADSGDPQPRGFFASEQRSGAVPVRFGGYSREQMLPYLDRFVAVRRSVTIPANFLGTMISIFWDDELEAARFSEFNKFVSSDGREMDYSQAGTLHMSAHIGMLHLLTSRQGALRLITLTRLQVQEPVMYGAILTQVPESGYFMPAKSTIHLRRILPEKEEEARDLIGPITPSHPSYERIVRDLDDADRAIYTR